MSDYHLQSAVPLSSRAYVERHFEQLVLQQVLAGNWVLLLGPRQHGKTTGLIRVKKNLRDVGILCTTVDLQRLPPCNTYQALLSWFSRRVGRELDRVGFNDPVGFEADDLGAWLERAVPSGRQPVTIIVDEAGGIRNQEWREAFYGQIRSLSSERAEAGEDDLASRLRFIFAGTFRPETLVDERNSPFNVCKRIETEDLTLEQARMLEQQATRDTTDLFADKAYKLVGGQPYLLQLLLSQVAEVELLDRQEAFDVAVELLRAGDNDHFESIFSKVTEEARLINIVARPVSDGRVANQAADADLKYLQVLGVAKRDGGYLFFRNDLYAEFARANPQIRLDNSPTTPAVGLIVPTDETYTFMRNAQLREITISAEQGATRAYNTGSYRLSLAGFGCALESLLLDWLLTLSPSDLAIAVASVRKAAPPPVSFTKYEDPTKPNTWRLVNLVRVARAAPESIGVVEPHDALREWRNCIHPAEALKKYSDEQALKPEAFTASGLLSIARRDVSKALQKR